MRRNAQAKLNEPPAAGRHGGTINPTRRSVMRSILLWLLGVPIPIIILIALFTR